MRSPARRPVRPGDRPDQRARRPPHGRPRRHQLGAAPGAPATAATPRAASRRRSTCSTWPWPVTVPASRSNGGSCRRTEASPDGRGQDGAHEDPGRLISAATGTRSPTATTRAAAVGVRPHHDQARKLKAQRQHEVESGEFQQQARVRFAEYACEWVERYQGRGRGFRESTRDDYRRDLERYAIPYLHGTLRRTLSQVTPRDVANFVGWLCDEEEQGLAARRRASPPQGGAQGGPGQRDPARQARGALPCRRDRPPPPRPAPGVPGNRGARGTDPGEPLHRRRAARPRRAASHRRRPRRRGPGRQAAHPGPARGAAARAAPGAPAAAPGVGRDGTTDQRVPSRSAGATCGSTAPTRTSRSAGRLSAGSSGRPSRATAAATSRSAPGSSTSCGSTTSARSGRGRTTTHSARR